MNRLIHIACTATLFTFILLDPNLNAQARGVRLVGYITEADSKNPVVGANVIIYEAPFDSNKQSLTGTASDADGFYTTPRLEKGNYVIFFKSIGYKEHIEQVKLTINEGTLELNIKLKQSSVELQEVVVSDEKLKTNTISTINVSPKLLSLLPSISGEMDIFRSLQLLPGVKVASELSSGIYVRGGSPDQNLTLIDGAIIYNPAHLGNIASTFNTNAIHDINLIKGAFPAEYGGRLSSVLDIRLREGTKEREKGMIGLGAINSHGTLEGPINDNLTYIVSSRIMYYDKIQEAFQKKSVTPRYNFFDINAKLNYKITQDENVSLNYIFSSDNVYSPPINLGFEYGIKWSNAIISANWLKLKEGSYLHNTNFSYITYDFSSSLNDVTSDTTANDYYSSSKLGDFLLKENLELQFSDEYKLKTGFEFVYHSYELINWNLYDPILETSSDHSEIHNSYEISAFIQNEIQPFSFFSTNLGFRIYKFSQSQKLTFEPRLSLAISFTDDIIIKAAYAEAQQFLHLILRNDIRLPTDLWFSSTKNTLPSKSRQAVVGLEIYADEKRFLFSLEGYYKDFKNIYEFIDMPEYSVEKSIETLFTRGKGEAYGIEFFFNKREGVITGWIGYTLSWTKRLFNDLNAGRIFTPRYDRRHDVSFVLTYELASNFNIGLTWTFSSGPGITIPTAKYYFSNPELDGSEKVYINYSKRNAYSLPDYHKLDLNLKYTTLLFDLETDIYLNLYNVYNRKNAFAQYVSYDFDKDNNTYDYTSSPKLRQVTLMPFIPTFGFVVKF